MFNELVTSKFAVLIICFACLQIAVYGQDLGSSSGLFNSPNPKANSKIVGKKAAKKKTSVSTIKKTVAASRTKRNASALKAANAKSKAARQAIAGQKAKSEPQNEQNNIIITVGHSTADEIFDQDIEAGNAARNEREYQKAEAAYLRAKSLKAKDSRAVYGLGNLYSDQQRWEEAERAYRAAIEIEPKNSDAYVALSFILTQPIVGANLADRYSEAEQMTRRAIQLDGDNAVAYDQLGAALELGGIISEETRSAYQKAIELDSTFALAYAHLGRLLRKKGLNNESALAYRNAIQMSVGVPTMILVADVMQSQQHYLESEQLLRRALREDPKNPTALFLLGRALTTRGSYDEAERVLQKSAEISPNSFVSYALLGSLFARREKYDEAERYLMRGLTVVSPNEKKRFAPEFEAVGDGYLRAGKKPDAARVFRLAAALDKDKETLAEKLIKAETD